MFPSFLVYRAGQDNTRQLTFSEEGNIIIKTRRNREQGTGNREQETGTGTGNRNREEKGTRRVLDEENLKFPL